MRLIDADELRWAIINNASKSVPICVYQTIDNAPTAYDPDKVMEQLEDNFNATEDKGVRLAYHHAIEIVKGGGVDAD